MLTTLTIIIYCIAFVLSRKRPLVQFLLVLQILSIGGSFLLSTKIEITTTSLLANSLFTFILTSLVIFPWSKHNKIRNVYSKSNNKIRSIKLFLLAVSIPSFILFLSIAIMVFSVVSDIHTFKTTGALGSYIFNIYPKIAIFYSLAIYLHYFSYFLIPLHFYYAIKKDIKNSVICFIFSLTPILYGLTYFSRSALLNYLLIYIALLILIYPSFDSQIRKRIKKIFFVFLLFIIFIFSSISSQRFSGTDYYSDKINKNSLITNPVYVSYIYYLSQSYENNLTLLDDYNFKTFQGKTTLQPILLPLSKLNLISYDSENYTLLRKELWPNHWKTFNGLISYSVYDYGYLLTILIFIFYNRLVVFLRPKINKKTKIKEISIIRLFALTIFVQIPLLSIFYGTMGNVIIQLIYLGVLIVYSKKTIKLK